MKLSVVTSFNQTGYIQYGRRCIETLHEHWPREIALYVISEDVIDLPNNILNEREVHFFNLYEASVQAKDFHIMHVHNLKAHGRSKEDCSPKYNRHWKTGYNFRRDAYKFSKKIFAIDIAAKHARTGKLIWLDADTVSLAAVPLNLFDSLLPENQCLAYLDRGSYHSECGFVIYNLDQSETLRFISEFVGLYHTGDVFNLAEWHDSWVFDWLRRKLCLPTYKIPHKNNYSPFNASKLGKYMDHFKGDRKVDGSKPREKTTKRYPVKWVKSRRTVKNLT